ncbi:hypothetical protein DV515_00019211, partial [Chloebia gouldiae]
EPLDSPGPPALGHSPLTILAVTSPFLRFHAPSFCDESLFGAKPPGPARAAPRMRKEDVAKLHSLLWSPPPAPQNQPGLSPHCRGTPLRAVHPPASAPPATSEPGHEEKSCAWRHPGSDACSKGWGAPGRARSQSVSRLSTPPDRIHLSSNLGTERWKNQSTPTTPAAPQGPLVRGRSNSVSGSPVPKNAKAAGGCTARPPWNPRGPSAFPWLEVKDGLGDRSAGSSDLVVQGTPPWHQSRRAWWEQLLPEMSRGWLSEEVPAVWEIQLGGWSSRRQEHRYMDIVGTVQLPGDRQGPCSSQNRGCCWGGGLLLSTCGERCPALSCLWECRTSLSKVVETPRNRGCTASLASFPLLHCAQGENSPFIHTNLGPTPHGCLLFSGIERLLRPSQKFPSPGNELHSLCLYAQHVPWCFPAVPALCHQHLMDSSDKAGQGRTSTEWDGPRLCGVCDREGSAQGFWQLIVLTAVPRCHQISVPRQIWDLGELLSSSPGVKLEGQETIWPCQRGAGTVFGMWAQLQVSLGWESPDVIWTLDGDKRLQRGESSANWGNCPGI